MDPRRAEHTVVVSDLHLTEAERPDPVRPLWKRYKQPDLFVDTSFQRFLAHLVATLDGEIELVLAGDVFDFDAVLSRPDDTRTTWLERKRGLAPEQDKSRFKMRRILADHPVWVDALRDFVIEGHRLVFVIGNHDLELHWPGVQDEVREALDLPEGRRDGVRFCEWFYVSNGDTLVEHGNQYDRYCLCQDPLHPFVGSSSNPRVRLPFGNLAGKLMLNGMGLFNPHVESSFILSFREYMVFFYRHMVRVQPLLLWTWAWGAMATLLVSLREGFLPGHRDPFSLEGRVEAVAARSNASPGMVRALNELRVHPAIFNPWMVARELWLDRGVLLLLVFYGSFQLYSVVNLFSRIPFWWIAVALMLFLPPFLFYARSVNSEVDHVRRAVCRRMPLAVQLTGVRHFVYGHTHDENHTTLGGISLLNTGTWSPAYRDVACTIPYGRKCFAWIRPGPAGRIAELHEWTDPGTRPLGARTAEEPQTGLRDRLRDTLTGLPVPRLGAPTLDVRVDPDARSPEVRRDRDACPPEGRD